MYSGAVKVSEVRGHMWQVPVYVIHQYHPHVQRRSKSSFSSLGVVRSQKSQNVAPSRSFFLYFTLFSPKVLSTSQCVCELFETHQSTFWRDYKSFRATVWDLRAFSFLCFSLSTIRFLELWKMRRQFSKRKFAQRVFHCARGQCKVFWLRM